MCSAGQATRRSASVGRNGRQVSTVLHPSASLPHAQVDVTDFGAKGDGITDDTEAFIRAIAKASELAKPFSTVACGGRGDRRCLSMGDGFQNKGANGVAVLIPAGTYRITRMVEIAQSNVVLRGEGVRTAAWGGRFGLARLQRSFCNPACAGKADPSPSPLLPLSPLLPPPTSRRSRRSCGSPRASRSCTATRWTGPSWAASSCEHRTAAPPLAAAAARAWQHLNSLPNHRPPRDPTPRAHPAHLPSRPLLPPSAACTAATTTAATRR